MNDRSESLTALLISIRALLAAADKDAGGDRAHHELDRALIRDVRRALEAYDLQEEPFELLEPWERPPGAR